MASDTHSNSAQKNTLGELLVRIGTEGLGNTIKGLNAVSASFLLTKNAAQQAIQPIKQMVDGTAKNVLGLEKVSARMGLPIMQLKQMQNWLKLNNVEADSFIGQLEDLQQQIVEGRLKGAIKEGFILGGILPTELDTKNVINLMEQIRIAYNKVSKEDPALATEFLTEMGLNAKELPFLFKNVKKSIQEDIIDAQEYSVELTEKNYKNIRDAADATARLNVAWQTFSEKFAATTAPIWIETLDKISDALLFWGGSKKASKEIKTESDVRTSKRLLIRSLPAFGMNMQFPDTSYKNTKNTKNIKLEPAVGVPADKSVDQALPNLPSTTQKNVTVNQTNNVTVNSAKEAYEYVATAEQMEQYEKNNIRANQGVNQ